MYTRVFMHNLELYISIVIPRNGFKRHRQYSPSQTPFLKSSKQSNKPQPTNYTNPESVQDPAVTRSGIYSYVEVDRSSSREQLVSPYGMIEDTEIYATTTARENPQWPRGIPSHMANGNGVHKQPKDRESVRNGSAMVHSKVVNNGHYDFHESHRPNDRVGNASEQTKSDLRGKPVPVGNVQENPSKPRSSKMKPTDRIHPYEVSEIVLSQSHGSKFKIAPRDWSTLPKGHYECADEAAPNLKSPFGANLKPVKMRKRPQDDPDVDAMYATPHTRRQFEVSACTLQLLSKCNYISLTMACIDLLNLLR